MSQSNGNVGTGRFDALEQRVHMLEETVAATSDTRQLEDRLAERVTERVVHCIALPAPSASHIVDNRRNATRTPALPNTASAPPRWLLQDIYLDARTIWRMFFDPNYRISPGTGLMTAGLCVAIALSWFLTSKFIPFIGFLIGRIADVLLFFVLFKLLTREANRYRTMMPGAVTHQRY